MTQKINCWVIFQRALKWNFRRPWTINCLVWVTKRYVLFVISNKPLSNGYAALNQILFPHSCFFLTPDIESCSGELCSSRAWQNLTNCHWRACHRPNGNNIGNHLQLSNPLAVTFEEQNRSISIKRN